MRVQEERCSLCTRKLAKPRSLFSSELEPTEASTIFAIWEAQTLAICGFLESKVQEETQRQQLAHLQEGIVLASDALNATVAHTTEQLQDVGAQLASVEESVGGVSMQVRA